MNEPQLSLDAVHQANVGLVHFYDVALASARAQLAETQAALVGARTELTKTQEELVKTKSANDFLTQSLATAKAELEAQKLQPEATP